MEGVFYVGYGGWGATTGADYFNDVEAVVTTGVGGFADECGGGATESTTFACVNTGGGASEVFGGAGLDFYKDYGVIFLGDNVEFIVVGIWTEAGGEDFVALFA